MQTRRVLLHLALATVTWSALFGLLSTLRKPNASLPMSGETSLGAPASDVQPTPIPEPVSLPQMSRKHLRIKERTLATSSDGDSIIDAVFDLYSYHFCRIGEEATLRRIEQLLSRNRSVDYAYSRGGYLDFQMKDGVGGTLMLYTAAPDCR